MVREDDFEEETREEGAGAEEEAEEVLLEAEFNALEGLSTVFDHGQLDDDGADENDQEQFVVEEVFEDVVLVRFQLSGVDFVEDLEEHENVEEDGFVFAGLIVPFADSDRRGDSEDFGTCV